MCNFAMILNNVKMYVQLTVTLNKISMTFKTQLNVFSTAILKPSGKKKAHTSHIQIRAIRVSYARIIFSHTFVFPLV